MQPTAPSLLSTSCNYNLTIFFSTSLLSYVVCFSQFDYYHTHACPAVQLINIVVALIELTRRLISLNSIVWCCCYYYYDSFPHTMLNSYFNIVLLITTKITYGSDTYCSSWSIAEINRQKAKRKEIR